ncbi:MAG: copper homeostasis protein CutC, partial [Verrucomicrobiae bacterium]|nr:copper homeostasis protein CutC [Verrucomicrobiae bacterium]
MILEVCIESAESATNAESGGANRVELCDNLMEGGTTPSSGMVALTLERVSIPVMMMIRPRGGDFLYTDLEYEIMLRDIKEAKRLGVHGVVFGLLTPDGRVDKERTARLVEDSRPLSVTFHRAFDM